MKRTINGILLPSLMVILLASGCANADNYKLRMTLEPQGTMNMQMLDEASGIIMKRLTKFGIPEERINIETLSNGLKLTINGIDTSKTDIVSGLAITTGDLDFRETFENEEVIQYLVAANNKLKEMDKQVVSADTSANAEMEKFRKENPLFGVLMPRVDHEGKPVPSCLVGLVYFKDTATVAKLLNLSEINLLFPRNLYFLWSKVPYEYDQSQTLYELHSIKQTSFDKRPPLSGEEVVSSRAVTDRSRINIFLQLSMTPEGAQIWSRMTSENINRCIAIVVDGKVVSYPRVQSEVTGGNTEITGSFTLSEAQALAAILSSGGGKLPLSLKIAKLKIEETE